MNKPMKRTGKRPRIPKKTPTEKQPVVAPTDITIELPPNLDVSPSAVLAQGFAMLAEERAENIKALQLAVDSSLVPDKELLRQLNEQKELLEMNLFFAQKIHESGEQTS